MEKDWARKEAFIIFNSIMTKGAYSGIEIRKNLNKSNLDKNDRALVTEIVNGTLRNLIKIDWIISRFVKLNPKKITPSIRDILRCGIYQIMFLDKIPDFAVCNESVELAKLYGNSGAAKFVNGVLRNIVRNKDNILLPDKANIIEYYSIEYSHPTWMVDLWIKDYGVDFTEKLLKANNVAPPLTIRINKLKTDKDEMLNSLNDINITTSSGLLNDEAINIKGSSSLDNMDLFKKGFFQVQDESSMLVGKIMNPKAGDLIIDVCSAPGGKATHMAEIMGNQGKIIARDIHKHKLNLIEQNCKRLGIKIIETQLFDAAKVDNTLFGKADGVLVDAPCSGLGLVRRKPDLRWKREEQDIGKLSELQLLILKNASLYVKTGGALVYSTCTLNTEENIQIVREFLSYDSSFKLDSIERFLPANIDAPHKKDGYLELYPNVHGTDGFFIARMTKIANPIPVQYNK